MKKASLFVAIAAISVGTLVSCGKSSKGKMDGEWNMDSVTYTGSSTGGGNSSTTNTKIDGSTYSKTETDQNGTTVETGTVSTAVWNIKKDGTWEQNLNYTINEPNISTNYSVVTSGNWDFAAGVGEFKKNERVMFSTLAANVTKVVTAGLLSTTTTSSATYADGETTETYVITESKKKSLEMETKNANTWKEGTNSTNGNSTLTYKMTLK